MAEVPATAADRHAALADLFRQGVAGDAASYGKFLQAVSTVLRGVIVRKLAAGDAEDVLQEILISVHKARHTYDGQRPLLPWLLAIAQFRINDHLRKHYAGARWETVDVDSVAETLVAVTEPATVSESIDELLNPVAEREQRILTLMHVEGRTAKETGNQLGMSESAVKVAAHRAIKKLRELLRP